MSFSLGGIASGLDTHTIISQLMQIERIPYTKLQQKQSSLNSEQSIFRTINTKLLTLRTAAEELSLSFGFDLRSAKNSDETVLRAVAEEGVPEGDYTIEVKQLATKHSVKSKELTNLDEELDTDLQITINSQSFTIEAGDGKTLGQALEELVQKINTTSDVGVSATLMTTNENAKTLVITSKKSGESNEISYEDNTDPEGYFEFETATAAQNAEFKINGVDVTSSSNEIKDVVPGLHLTLLKADETATVTVQRDTDKVIEKVEAFVKAYNDVISTLKNNTAKEKSLQGDSTLRNLEMTLNKLVNRQVGEISGSDGFNFLFQIGLEVDKGKVSAESMNGQLSFDKDKFKSAFEANPDEVIKLFSYKDDNDDSINGIARQMKDSLMEWTAYGTGILAMKIDGYDSEIKLLDQQMESMQVRLDMRETQLKKQFDAMETALIQLQNQRTWLASQIASLGISY